MEIDSVGVGGVDDPRVVVIDAANVAWSYVEAHNGSVDTSTVPPMEGLESCVRFWLSYGISKIFALAPHWWKEHTTHYRRFRPDLLYFSPSGEHDDHYLIDYAVRSNGFVVTNDRFRDHVFVDKDGSTTLDSEWLRTHRIGFMFIGNDFTPNPVAMSNVRFFNSNESSTLSSTSSSNTVFKRRVARPLIKHVVGKRGATINRLRNESGGAKIDIDDDVVVVTGNLEQIQRAKILLEELLRSVASADDSRGVRYAKPDVF